MTDCPPHLVDPVGEFRACISHNTKVATAGSCFAQHIARRLRGSGYNYYVTEPGHPILPEEIRARNNYGMFSARYGNIYTARQLLQLFQRAYGEFIPIEDVWREEDDVVLDPFRPTVQPGGFVSELEMRLDRAQHFHAVRSMFEAMDVLVFTLGLTECWVSSADGAVFPICPGVSGGNFHPARHAFYNQTVEDVVSDMTEFLRLLARVNPSARVIITVSPVPLAATARPDQHVLTATTYSKSVLRVAADILATRFAHVTYFPSYEVITGAFSRGAYYAEDLRNVRETGVSHVMSLFMKHATLAPEFASTQTSQSDSSSVRLAPGSAMSMAELIEVECDEAALDRR
ncbi:hypothetical protein M2337_002746 [Sphingobium sp. B2D3A]|uniref:GSCFA domain-containing protein n=1 Tax=unclassified Sphingobium TaxID=2611147 RepID=UPI0022256581|nr:MULTISPECIES: GSCFA domain-containing protein [unclassified Sphingobium]MCW2338513.1 hypothetical protein [Sphingobium sp. B2D3A]MCW2384971.1 hypothetical protein [Sphingobium sp. B2D3D]